ncbi:MAG: hypothetical protein JOZ51_27395, partial [Chloroflexi bacterium]|nr:hypothetical protein [Chloroflexota bacterium]
KPGTQTLIGQYKATNDASNYFIATLTNLPIGTYDIQVKASNTLSNKRTNIDLSTPAEIDFGTLRVGDSNGNDNVNGADVSYMIPSFLLSSGDAGFLPYADTNNNGAINGADVSALVPNFLKSGPFVDGAALTPTAQQARAQSATPPTIALSPTLSQIKLDEIVQIQAAVALGTSEADTVDLYLNFDPQLLEIVDAGGQPITSLTRNTASFTSATYNKVDNQAGQINLSVSRLDATVTGNSALVSFYVRAKRSFTTTAITVAKSGARQSEIFVGGTPLQAAITGGALTMGEVHRVYVPSALR